MEVKKHTSFWLCNFMVGAKDTRYVCIVLRFDLGEVAVFQIMGPLSFQ
jgi:hypothetical protein